MTTSTVSVSKLLLLFFACGILAVQGSPAYEIPSALAAGVDISVTKTDGKATIAAGQTNSYSITATNVGTAATDAAYVYDALPLAYDPKTTVISCPGCGYVEGNGTAYPYVEMTLLPGQSITLTITAKVKSNAKGTITNTAQAGAWPAGTDGNAANNTATDTTVIGSATPAPTPSPSPTPTVSPSPSPTATPTPSATPSPIPTATATPTPQPGGLERGIWFYDRTLPIGQTKINDVLSNAELYDFNAIYYTIEDYPALLAANNQTKIAQMRDALRKLAVQAAAKGIRIDAMAGERDWGEEPNYKDALDTADFVIEYNRTAAPNERVGALQLDVEPQTLSTYENNKGPILTRYVGMIDAVAKRMKASGVGIGLDIVAPHYFDSVKNWTPMITFGGKTQHTYNHVLDALQQIESSKYIIMDYRNFTDTLNGSIELARVEIEQASAAHSKTKLVIAQETGNYPPAGTISFYGMCRSKLENALVTLQTRFQNESSFGGFSINSYATYLALKSC